MFQIPSSEAELPVILSIDVGTSSVRTNIFDARGFPVQRCGYRIPVELISGLDGKAEINATRLMESLWTGIDRTLEKVSERMSSQIVGVAISTLASSLLGVNPVREPVTPLYIYADTRAEEDARNLRQRLDPDLVLQRTGCTIHSSYLPARFLWLNRVHPGLFSDDTRWMSIGEYIFLMLFGSTGASYSIASWTGLLNRRCLEWDSQLLGLLPIKQKHLSELVDIGHSWSGLQEPYASRWPALRDCPWLPAVGDGAAANIGSGCLSREYLAITMGSSTALRIVMKGNVESVPRGLWCYLVDGEHPLLGGALSEGGNVFAWLMKTLKLELNSGVDSILSSVLPDSHGLTFMPALAGERSPGWRGDLRGTIAGLSLSTLPEEIFRAALEGIAYRIGLIYDLLEPYLEEEHKVVASGGALVNSPGWVQILADVLGRRVLLSNVEEASARGAAMLALWKLGLVPSLETFLPAQGSEFSPNPHNYEIYRHAMQRQQKLYEMMV